MQRETAVFQSWEKKKRIQSIKQAATPFNYSVAFSVSHHRALIICSLLLVKWNTEHGVAFQAALLRRKEQKLYCARYFLFCFLNSIPLPDFGESPLSYSGSTEAEEDGCWQFPARFYCIWWLLENLEFFCCYISINGNCISTTVGGSGALIVVSPPLGSVQRKHCLSWLQPLFKVMLKQMPRGAPGGAGVPHRPSNG